LADLALPAPGQHSIFPFVKSEDDEGYCGSVMGLLERRLKWILEEKSVQLSKVIETRQEHQVHLYFCCWHSSCNGKGSLPSPDIFIAIFLTRQDFISFSTL